MTGTRLRVSNIGDISEVNYTLGLYPKTLHYEAAKASVRSIIGKYPDMVELPWSRLLHCSWHAACRDQDWHGCTDCEE